MLMTGCGMTLGRDALTLSSADLLAARDEVQLRMMSKSTLDKPDIDDECDDDDDDDGCGNTDTDCRP